ncbi:Uncharacterised protein [uncultured archaeon]|nr:Uncharacterised protein [uncultured archaeon]
MFLESMVGFRQMWEDPNFRQVVIGSAFGGLAGVLVGAILIVLIILAAAFYVYMAFVWMTIAKKLGYKKAWLAWIPIANLFLLPILAKRHWAWGWLFLLPPVYFILAIVWIWKIYERRNYPGWLSLFLILWILPVLKGVGVIANLIIFGFVAWKDKKASKRKR